MEFQELGSGSSFSFDCGPHLACFTECCRKLKLILTPYDCLKLKTHLNLSSDRFLEEYCDLKYEEGLFPFYYLRMREDESCPFLSPSGCRVYEARPAACRLYPVGRGSTFVTKEKELFFLVRERHCLGHQVQKHWSISEWLAHEGVVEYDRANAPWVQIVTSTNRIPKQGIEKKLKMFLMASYNIDKFREFVFGTKFFQIFPSEEAKREIYKEDDTALLRLAMEFLKLSFLGESQLKPRN